MATWLAVGMQCDGCRRLEPASRELIVQAGQRDISVQGVPYLCAACEAKKNDPDPPPNVGFV